MSSFRLLLYLVRNSRLMIPLMPSTISSWFATHSSLLSPGSLILLLPLLRMSLTSSQIARILLSSSRKLMLRILAYILSPYQSAIVSLISLFFFSISDWYCLFAYSYPEHFLAHGSYLNVLVVAIWFRWGFQRFKNLLMRMIFTTLWMFYHSGFSKLRASASHLKCYVLSVS